jgi:hypothetical protein
MIRSVERFTSQGGVWATELECHGAVVEGGAPDEKCQVQCNTQPTTSSAPRLLEPLDKTPDGGLASLPPRCWLGQSGRATERCLSTAGIRLNEPPPLFCAAERCTCELPATLPEQLHFMVEFGSTRYASRVARPTAPVCFVCRRRRITRAVTESLLRGPPSHRRICRCFEFRALDSHQHMSLGLTHATGAGSIKVRERTVVVLRHTLTHSRTHSETHMSSPVCRSPSPSTPMPSRVVARELGESVRSVGTSAAVPLRHRL